MMNSELSKYTISVYELMEMAALGKFNFGMDKYPIFDEAYRPILNDAILQHYKWREIGFTNPNMWADRLNQRLALIMRNKYNALYKAKMTDFNPLFNVDMTETYIHDVDNKGTVENSGVSQNTSSLNNNTSQNTSNDVKTSSTTSNDSLGINSTFPSEEMLENDFSEGVYADSSRKDIVNSTTTDSEETENSQKITSETNSNDKTLSNDNTKSNTTTTETYTRKTQGSSAGLPFSKALIQLKEFYDQYQLDQQVIAELKDLFFNKW